MAIDWHAARTGAFRFVRVGFSTRDELEEIATIRPGGSLTRNVNTSLKEAGQLTAAGPLSIGDDLLRVYYDVTDEDGASESIAIATMHAATERSDFSAASEACSLRLYSALLALEQDRLDASLTVASGTVAVSKAAEIAVDLGLPVVASASSKTLTADMSWDAGTTRLEVVNDLLEFAGFWSAGVDGWGRVVMAPYESPAARSVAWTFQSGEGCTFLPSVSRATDAFDVPNKCVLVASMLDSTLVGSYTNDDPLSPFSTVSRGRTIAITDTVSDAETTEDLVARAQMRLAAATSSSETVVLSHAYAPVTIGDAVRLRWSGRGIDHDAAVQSQELTLVPSLMTRTTAKRIWR
jgi:hypothetical protein